MLSLRVASSLANSICLARISFCLLSWLTLMARQNVVKGSYIPFNQFSNETAVQPINHLSVYLSLFLWNRTCSYNNLKNATLNDKMLFHLAIWTTQFCLQCEELNSILLFSLDFNIMCRSEYQVVFFLFEKSTFDTSLIGMYNTTLTPDTKIYSVSQMSEWQVFERT